MHHFTLPENLFLLFVRFFHRNQKRKYTGEPYYHHPVNVAITVHKHNSSPEVVAIALGHDLLEDTKCTIAQLKIILSICGFSKSLRKEIINGIIDLTDIYTNEAFPDNNRIQRKKWETIRLGAITPIAQDVKCADLHDNTQTITKHDPEFALTYLREKEALISVLLQANPNLRDLAKTNIQT